MRSPELLSRSLARASRPSTLSDLLVDVGGDAVAGREKRSLAAASAASIEPIWRLIVADQLLRRECRASGSPEPIAPSMRSTCMPTSSDMSTPAFWKRSLAESSAALTVSIWRRCRRRSCAAVVELLAGLATRLRRASPRADAGYLATRALESLVADSSAEFTASIAHALRWPPAADSPTSCTAS